MIKITPKQKAVLEYITFFYQKNGYSPTLKQIAHHFKKSVPTIHQYVKILTENGWLEHYLGQKRSFIPKTSSSSTPTSFRRQVRIGIVGFGIVGQAVEYGFSNQEIHIYDKYKKSEKLDEVAKKSDYIFICLPTPIRADGSGIDLSIIEENIEEIARLAAGTDKIIVIKSTVIPGTTKKLMKKYSKCFFCFNPEFLTERAFLQDFINADRIIIGVENDLVFRRVSSIYQMIMPKTPIFQTDPTTAEMVKYMANCFLATKVIFANEMYDICTALGIKYEEVKKMVVADSRIYDSHLDVTTLRGFGGKCFPKDLLALRALAKKLGCDSQILDSVWSKNLKIRKTHDWEEIPFAVSSKAFGHRG